MSHYALHGSRRAVTLVGMWIIRTIAEAIRWRLLGVVSVVCWLCVGAPVHRYQIRGRWYRWSLWETGRHVFRQWRSDTLNRSDDHRLR